MIVRRWSTWLLAVGLALMAGLVPAAPPVPVQSEIEYLLGSVATSECRFYRNGEWYDAKRAADHLRSKYRYLTQRDLIRTTDDFIELAASRSSLSNRDYEIKCPGSGAVTSAQWFRDKLTRYRESKEPVS